MTQMAIQEEKVINELITYKQQQCIVQIFFFVENTLYMPLY